MIAWMAGNRFGFALSASALLVLTFPSTVAAQAPCRGAVEPIHMRMLLEKTIFNVDVLWLSVRIDGPSATSLGGIASAERTDERADSVATLAVGARCATATLDFVRDVSLDRFLGGIRESSRAAREAGLIGEEIFRTIDGNLSGWYAFLEDRGVAEGDRMTYRIRGDTLNIRFRTADGELLLDRTDVGEAGARSVLAGYFAPDSDFREGLIRSLFEGAERGEAAGSEEARGRDGRKP